jgi:two-component system CheB/CheR fusion protein
MKKQAITKSRLRKVAPVVARKKPSLEPHFFPIVGIGSSAGGLETLDLFLRHVPPACGMAFVIVQHLDPTRKGIMAELLQRATTMKVVQVRDRTPVRPNCVYVIPPNKDMSILHGILHLLVPLGPRGLRLPIDFFFRSLAADQQERSLGVILSGMGSDGTLGLRAIKEKTGAVFVQEPASAKFDGMPRSAIDAGLADMIAPVEELPGKIQAYFQHLPFPVAPGIHQEDKSSSAWDKIVILLRAQTGHDFSLYKKNTVYRRVERRMAIHQIDHIAHYVRFLRENPQETELLFKELLIGVTSFFRNPEEWQHLREKGIPALIGRHSHVKALRAWVPGCSTGEEAYSLAMVFKMAQEKLKPAQNCTLQVYATDLDRDSIERARKGHYPSNIAADVPAEYLGRFFAEKAHGYQVVQAIREMVIFAQQNVIMDPPFTKLDILSCRNLLIYLAPELQKKLLPLFHYSLSPGGILFLGSSESIGSFGNLFEPLDAKSHLFRRRENVLPARAVEFPSSFGAPPLTAAEIQQPGKPVANLQKQVERLLLQSYLPAAVLVNGSGDILFINGRTGKYLEPAAGKANWNIFAMSRPGLRLVLGDAFALALRQKSTVTRRNVAIDGEGVPRALDLTIRPLNEPEVLNGLVLVVFSDVEPSPAAARTPAGRARLSSAREKELERELQRTQQEIKANRVAMQTSQEELKSINEELQSGNEELQSANEKLTTSKEEMQSLNEELQTVNNEIQVKLDELAVTNNDLKNVLDSTEIAILFLDDSLRVRRFTPQMVKISKLIAGDVGRPITDIVSDLIYPEFAANAREVLRTLVFSEKQVVTRSGQWFIVRIMPYRTLEDMIDGLVITFMDITATKSLEAELRKTQARMEKRIEEQDSVLNRTPGDMK